MSRFWDLNPDNQDRLVRYHQKRQGHRSPGGLARDGCGCFVKLQAIATTHRNWLTDVGAIALQEFDYDKRISACTALAR